MAITQDRLITLIEIIDKLYTRSLSLQAYIERNRLRVEQAESYRELISLYTETINAMQAAVRLEPEEYARFVDEANHFKYSAGKNRVSAEAAKRYRQREKQRREEIKNENYLTDLYASTQANSAAYSAEQIVDLQEKKFELSKPKRDSALDNITLDEVWTFIQGLKPAPDGTLTVSDLAEMFRPRGGTDEEITQWYERLKEEGLIEPGQFTGEFRKIGF